MRSLAFAVVAVTSLFALPQDPVGPDTLKRAQQLARTGPQHEMLARLVGTWDVEVRTMLPGQPERTERGALAAKTMLGGRYVALYFDLKLQGRVSEAVQILGYDNLSGQYTASWRDDHSTWAVECLGVAALARAPQQQLRGRLRDVGSPDGRPFRLALTLPEAGGDTATALIYDTLDGAEYLLQAQQWSRR